MRVIVLLLSVCTILFSACTETKEKKRSEWIWIDSEISVSPGSHESMSTKLKAGDTLDIKIAQTQGDYIAEVFIADSASYIAWLNDDYDHFFPIFYKQHGSGWEEDVKVHADGKYYFVIYNDALLATIKAQVYVKVIRWE